MLGSKASAPMRSLSTFWSGALRSSVASTPFLEPLGGRVLLEDGVADELPHRVDLGAQVGEFLGGGGIRSPPPGAGAGCWCSVARATSTRPAASSTKENANCHTGRVGRSTSKTWSTRLRMRA